METNLYEMIDLIHAPGVNRVLAEEFKNWESDIARRFTEYEHRRALYCKTLFSDADPAGLCWFDLQQYEPWKWRILNMDPRPPVRGYQYFILPKDVIDIMAESLTDRDRALHQKIRSAALDKEVEVRFVRYSNSHMFGTVRELSPGPFNWSGDMETAFQVFHELRDRHPEAVNGFMARFIEDSPPGEWVEPGPPDREAPPPGLKVTPARFSPQPENGGGVNLYTLIALLRLPELSKLLMLKLEELKDGPLREEIAAHLARKEHLLDVLPAYLRSSNGHGGGPAPYGFVLSRFAPGDWSPTRIVPRPEAPEQHQRLLPPAVIKQLIQIPTDPEKVMEVSIDIKGHTAKRVDFLVVRTASNCIIGAACENMAAWDEFSAGDKAERLLFLRMTQRPEPAALFINRFAGQMADLLPQQETSQ